MLKAAGSVITAGLALCTPGLVACTAFAADNELAIGATRVNGSVFLDLSQVDANGRGSSGADMKRFYFNVEHRFSPVWSARVNTDINWLRHQDPTGLWFKYAYLQGAFGKAFTLRVGSAPTPWSALVDDWSDYRYIDADLVSRVKVGETADWGLHVLGDFGPGGRFQYAAAMITGAGYKQPRLGSGPDFAARVSWQPGAHTVVAIGNYTGTLAQDVDGIDALHTARRWSAMAAYADARWRAGAQYFQTRDWGQVLKPDSDRGHGWSAWASVQLAPKLALFARHDRVTPSSGLESSRRERYSNAGVEWRARPWLRVAAVWKHTRLVDQGVVLKRADEAGVYAQINY